MKDYIFHECVNKLLESSILLSDSYESKVYINNNIIFKIFKDNIDTDNKYKKMVLMKERLSNNKIITARSFIVKEEKLIGYTMPYIKENTKKDIYFKRKKEKILYLEQIKKILDEAHENNIICSDFQNNIIVDENDSIHFIDHDNFMIDNLKTDVKNVFQQKYEKHVNVFDKRFDNYILNLYTISVLTKINMLYIYDLHFTNLKNVLFNDDEINEIIYNTIKLGKEYNEDLIINKISNNKELKKVRQGILF